MNFAKKFHLAFVFITVFTALHAGVTSMGEWSIFTPEIKMHLFERSQAKGSYQVLKNMGERANQAWHAKRDKDLIMPMSSIFDAATPDFIVDVIDEILNDNALLEKAVKSSYRNVTGFLKIVLVSTTQKGWKIRLHVWNQDEKEFPHNHKWDFYSKILSGYLMQDIYKSYDSEVKSAIKYKVCEPVSLMPILRNGELPCPCRDNYILSVKKDTACALYSSAFLGLQTRNIVGIGESYFMPNHLIHTISPGKDAISLVFTSDQVSENSEVFVPEETTSNLEKYAPSVTRDELIQELKSVKKTLQKLPLSGKYVPEMIDLSHRYYDKNNPLFREVSWRNEFLATETKGEVVQLNSDEKRKHIVSVSAGDEILIGGNKASSSQSFLFVLLDDVMYAAPKDFLHAGDKLICHTSFTDYAPVDSVGVLHLDDQSKLFKVEAYSGHYAPSTKDMAFALAHMKTLGCDVSHIEISEYSNRY